MAWFGATVKDVLRQIQNKDVDSSDFGGLAYVQKVMTIRENKIKGSMPRRFAEMVNLGEIRGQIVVASATEGQTVIDATQSIVDNLVSGSIYLYQNWRQPCPPVDNRDSAMIDPDDYSVSGNIITFTSTALSKGDNVIANYNTDWTGYVGLEDLQWMLVEGSALDLMANAGMANNPTILEDMTRRQENLTASMSDLRDGNQLPIAITELKLLFEIEANDDSQNTRSVNFIRG